MLQFSILVNIKRYRILVILEAIDKVVEVCYVCSFVN